ncbi:hypothetical protein ACIQTW_07760 [Paenarthrobacter sp. NPDC090517]|uniref:hypothetical protein n=1 Tax=Paenarthrobacter sp. NPDC090517 TaxID=3364381 RepID=UPI00382BBFD3
MSEIEGSGHHEMAPPCWTLMSGLGVRRDLDFAPPRQKRASTSLADLVCPYWLAVDRQICDELHIASVPPA